jgi:predicted enzyme related to lactoylglutathione lyase
VGVIFAVADVAAVAEFYETALGFEREVEYDEPAYVTLTKCGVRLSIAEQGHPAADLPDLTMTVPGDRHRPSAMLVIETDDCEALRSVALAKGARPASEVFRPPWGGARCFIADPEGNVIEIEQLA